MELSEQILGVPAKQVLPEEYGDGKFFIHASAPVKLYVWSLRDNQSTEAWIGSPCPEKQQCFDQFVNWSTGQALLAKQKDITWMEPWLTKLNVSLGCFGVDAWVIGTNVINESRVYESRVIFRGSLQETVEVMTTLIDEYEKIEMEKMNDNANS